MFKVGVIETSQLEWASPVVTVPKQNGTSRFCIDYCHLRLVTVKDSYPIPRMDDCIDSLGSGYIFTTIDCNCGYWQIPNAKEDQDKTSFMSHVGTFLRMPFGLTNAPATFQRAVVILLSRVQLQHCLFDLDDVIIYSKSVKEHIRHVEGVLTILQEVGVPLKLKKSEFFRKLVNHLGHTITPGKLHVAMERKEALELFKYLRHRPSFWVCTTSINDL